MNYTFLFIAFLLIVVIGLLVYIAFFKKCSECQKLTNNTTSLSSMAEGTVMPLDGNGKPVDWFLIIKLPSKMTDGDCTKCQPTISNCQSKTPSDIPGGSCYFYADSNNPKLTYYTDLGYECLDSGNNNPLYNTISQASTKNSWAVWNDQGYDGSSEKNCSGPNAHSKGMVCYDATGGFVLNVSTPHWPNSGDFSQSVGCQPINNSIYAQQFFCISMNSKNISTWKTNVAVGSLCLIASNGSFDFKNPGPSIPNVPLTTKGGIPITMTVKGADKYSPWTVVSAGLGGVPMSVASWTASSGASGWSTGSVYPGSGKMTQILTLKTQHGSFPSVYGHSHAKFGLAGDNKTVTFGSMNEQSTQFTRGGDFYSMSNPTLWNSLNSWVENTQVIQ